MKTPKVQNEKSNSATGNLFCTCNIPDIRRDDVTPIVALIGERTLNNGYIAMYVYLKYYGARFDTETELVIVYEPRTGEEYGRVPIQVFVDYLFEVQNEYRDYDTIRHAYECVGDSYAAKEIRVDSDGTRVKINRAYRTFKPADILYSSPQLKCPTFKDLDKWPLVFLLRCFNGMLTYFRSYCGEGYSVDEARKLAVVEYRKHKAIEEGNSAHKKKLNLSEEDITRLGLDVDPAMSSITTNTARMGYTSTGRFRAPRRERDREPARNAGGLFYDSQGNVREVTRDIQGNLRMPTRGRSVEDVLNEHEPLIRNALLLDPDFTLAAQTRVTLSVDTHGHEEFVISRTGDDVSADPAPASEIGSQPVAFRNSNGDLRIGCVDPQGNFRIESRGELTSTLMDENASTIRRVLNLDPDSPIEFQVIINTESTSPSTTDFVIRKLRSAVQAEPQPEPRPIEQTVAEPVTGVEAEVDRYRHYVGGRVHANLTVSTRPGAPIDLFHIQMRGRSYDRVILEENDAIRRAFRIPENESIFAVLNFTQVNEDKLTVARRVFKRRLEEDGSYIVPLHDRSQIEILQSEGAFLREAYSIPLGLRLTDALELIINGNHDTMMITKKLPVPSHYVCRVLKEGQSMMAATIRMDNQLRQSFNIPRTDSVFEHIYAEEEGDYFVFRKRQAVPLARRAANSSEPSDDADEPRSEDDDRDEDEYYEDDYDEDEEDR